MIPTCWPRLISEPRPRLAGFPVGGCPFTHPWSGKGGGDCSSTRALLVQEKLESASQDLGPFALGAPGCEALLPLRSPSLLGCSSGFLLSEGAQLVVSAPFCWNEGVIAASPSRSCFGACSSSDRAGSWVGVCLAGIEGFPRPLGALGFLSSLAWNGCFSSDVISPRPLTCARSIPCLGCSPLCGLPGCALR